MITEQSVKNYLEIENQNLEKQMKENIQDSENWKSFMDELARKIVRYAKNPSDER